MIDRGDGVRLAAALTEGARGPLILFLPGYMSDMAGTKALFLEDWAARSGRAFLRFDYTGCGRSEGRFEDGSIRRWMEDAAALLEALGGGRPLLLVGSSMGGWIGALLAERLSERVAGFVGIAAAPDFTRWGLALTPADRAALAEAGAIARPSRYGPDPYRYTARFVADSQALECLDRRIAIDAPVRLLHGMADPDVPFAISLRLAAAIRSPDVQVHLMKDGDHRLSRPEDLALLERTICALLSGGSAE